MIGCLLLANTATFIFLISVNVVQLCASSRTCQEGLCVKL